MSIMIQHRLTLYIRVFVLEIKRLSEYEIKVILNEKDMRIMNISFEDFEKSNKRSKDFLHELMFILKETGLIKIYRRKY